MNNPILIDTTLSELPLITTLASALGLALILGFMATRIRLPPLVGYLLAGIVIGPFTPGFVANTQIASELAEIGIMLLMFGVGLRFSLEDLWLVRKIAIPGAVIQLSIATILGTLLALSWGWTLSGAWVFGLALSVASTVVLLQALEARNAINSLNGQIAVGWLVVEDLAMVFVLVLLPLFADWFGAKQGAQSAYGMGYVLLITLLKILTFIGLMFVFGRRLFPKLLRHVAMTGSRELFTLSVIATAVGIAYGASLLFGVSFALGAFFAGMVMQESEFSHRAAEESLPLREAFAVLFFVSVGMLCDPMIVLEQPLQVLAVVAIIVIGKALAAIGLVVVLRYPFNTALTVAASLAQIGEFSFILSSVGVKLGLLPLQGQNLIFAGALISIALNPFMFKIIDHLQSGSSPRSTPLSL
ncbi:MAG: potassium proton antiporter [Gammaproteobacteria bacterium]|jgi:CPA2 family monovalent cation:H+ antiporter-2|nr:potassium proton antiporter [Gammaproteobacteria bacterium]